MCHRRRDCGRRHAVLGNSFDEFLRAVQRVDNPQPALAPGGSDRRPSPRTTSPRAAAAAASAVVATASGSAALTLTTGTFATSAKDSSQASALTNVTAGGHTHNLTLPVQIFQYIIKT